eukprot:CAMPEP_0167751490 /NCGR_PEP_ID=MMETSP0110_2-20121227/6608_1 /TAXON_ID=629695 /ORGANISM="Gymnochlora sp., Strain CCMP2014" /LENGTH=37 /DNA_ID= /DNA_START= /DNA_END= /DNA_ORIENTATION=
MRHCKTDIELHELREYENATLFSDEKPAYIFDNEILV